MAKKTIEIEGKQVSFVSNAATPLLYREQFHRDLISDMKSIFDNWKDGHTDLDLSCIEKIAYVMAKQGGSENTEDLLTWLGQFDGLLSIYQALPNIVELWQLNNATTSVAKKK